MGPNIPGEILVFAALAFDIVAGVGFFMLARGRESFDSLAHRAYLAFTVLIGLAVGYLYYLFYTHNFAIKYVYEYSERAQSAFYILAAFWGGQEGTYLLWLFFNALFGYIIIKKGGQYKNNAMVIYAVINLFFLAILTRVSPFALSPIPEADGMGLNPLLRDPWMVVHPPVVFVGYSMAAVPFAIALAALIQHDYTGWLRRVFPWVAITSLALAAGNVLGGFWAYKTLGWGGFWGWDPVENSSFVPWIISLALLHGLILERRSGALRRTNLMLTAFIFLLVVYGTFLTRSGVLADFSVHSFTDLGINNLLIGFMLFFLVLTLIVFVIRAFKIQSGPIRYNFYGREFSLFAGTVVLTLFALIVLFWTSLPLLTKLVGAEPRAANVATYNSFALPMAVFMAFLLAVSPLVDFSEFNPSRWKQRLLVLLVGSALLGFGLFYFVLHTDMVFVVLFMLIVAGMGMYLMKKVIVRALAPALAVFAATVVACILLGVKDYLHILFFATAFMAATSNVISLASFIPERWLNMGGQLTHFGFGLMLVGILASSAFGTSEKLVLPQGGQGEAFSRTLHYDGMAHDMHYPNNELLLTLDEGGRSYEIRPQLYFSERMQGTMRKPYVDRFLLYDLYMAPEQLQPPKEDSGLVLQKGEIRRVGDFDLTFNGFSMSNHGDSASGGMKVAALIDAEYKGTKTSISPAVQYETDSAGNSRMANVPATIAADTSKYQVSIVRILADQGAVVLSIPGLTGTASAEQLILDVSKKPMINFVWVGASLILLGAIIVFLRRRQELKRPDQPQVDLTRVPVNSSNL